MHRKGTEVWLAVVAILFITMVYLFMTVIQSGIPKPNSFFSEALGGLGFGLMLLTETAYSFRKRSRSIRWGRLASWFELHIFTGLVGPFLVLLHTSWKFTGIAGILSLLTLIIVISGIGGRYIYTAIPRTPDGVVLEKEAIEQRVREIEAQLQEPGESFTSLKSNRHLNSRERGQVRWLNHLIKQRDMLRRQLASLALMRRLLGYWYIFHIPIGLGMFVLAIIHIITAVYFANPVR
jgi:hypothetical protein